MGPAKTQLPGDKINSIFGNLENLVSANSKFMAELQMVQDGFVNIATVWHNFVCFVPSLYSLAHILVTYSLVDNRLLRLISIRCIVYSNSIHLASWSSAAGNMPALMHISE